MADTFGDGIFIVMRMSHRVSLPAKVSYASYLALLFVRGMALGQDGHRLRVCVTDVSHVI